MPHPLDLDGQFVVPFMAASWPITEHDSKILLNIINAIFYLVKYFFHARNYISVLLCIFEPKHVPNFENYLNFSAMRWKTWLLAAILLALG